MTGEIVVPTTQDEVDALEARYRPFLPVAAWTSVQYDVGRWQRYCDALAEAVDAAGPQRWRGLRDQFLRAAAMDSSALASMSRPMTDVTTVVLSQSLDSESWEAIVAAAGVVVECHRRALVVADDLAAAGRDIDALLIAQLQDLIVESQETFTVTIEDGSKREVALPRRQYKPVSNYLVHPGGDLVPFAPASKVAAEMARLADDLAGQTYAQLHPLVQAAFLHASLTRIHPFADGNGRLARTVASIPLLRASGLPLLVLVDQWPAYVEALNSAVRDETKPLVDLVTAAQVNALDLARMQLEARSRRPPQPAGVADTAERLLRDVVLVHARAASGPMAADVAVTATAAAHHAVRIAMADQRARMRRELEITVTADPADGDWLRLRCGDESLEIWRPDVWPAPVELTHLRVRAWIDGVLAATADDGAALRRVDEVRGLFVLGSPRSGTTLVGNYLGSHPDVLGLAEYGAFYVAHSVGPAYLQRLPGRGHDEFKSALDAAAFDAVNAQARAAGCSWFCDATPWNLEVAAPLAAQLPDAVFVLMLRHFSGAILSLSQFGWAGDSWEQVAKLWAKLNAAAVTTLPADRTVVVSYDELAAHPAETLAAIDEVTASLGLRTDKFDRRELARSHAAIIGKPRPTVASVVDGDVVLASVASLDQERWTPDVHAAVWPVVADVHRALSERFAGAYVSPPRPAHVPVKEW